MYLWKHRSLPLALFFCRNFVSWGFRLPCTARGVECRWYAMCFCYPQFRWVFFCTFAPYLHQDAWGGGGETVCSVFETSMKATEPLKHRCFNVGKSKSDQWHRAPWVPVHKVPSTKHRRWKSKVGDLHWRVEVLEGFPSCVKFPTCFANVSSVLAPRSLPCKKTTGKTHKGIVRCCCLNMFFLEFFCVLIIMKISCFCPGISSFSKMWKKFTSPVVQVEGKDQFVVACYGEVVGVVWSDDGTFQLMLALRLYMGVSSNGGFPKTSQNDHF